MENLPELNKFNLELALQAILWYGTGNHSCNNIIKIDLLKDIFEIATLGDLQKLYNLLMDKSIRIREVCFEDGTIEMCPINECPISLLLLNSLLTNRSIMYSFKDDLNNAIISTTEFFNDFRDCL